MGLIRTPPQTLLSPESPIVRLERALRRFRLQAAHNLLDELLAARPAAVVVRDVLLPLMRRLEGEAAVERLARSLFEARLLAQARGWERIAGPSVVLAGAPRHESVLELIGLGLALAERHCRIVYLAGATPTALLNEAVSEHPMAAVVVAADVSDLTAREREDLRRLPSALLLFGGAARELAPELGARALHSDLVAASMRAARVAHECSSVPGDDDSPAPRRAS